MEDCEMQIRASTINRLSLYLNDATHSFRVFRLSQYLQKIVIRQEIEARENLPFRLQVHIQ